VWLLIVARVARRAESCDQRSRRKWSRGGGFDNITNHANAALANGVIDPTHPSPTFIDANGHAFAGRIRYLGQQ